MKRHSLHFRPWLAIAGFFSLCTFVGAVPKTEKWGVHEIMLPGPATGNPYVEVTLDAEFRQGPTRRETGRSRRSAMSRN